MLVSIFVHKGTMAFYQKQTERNITWLLAGISGISLLAWLTNSYVPTLWSIIIFFVLLFTTTVTLTFFVLNHVRRSILVTLGITGLLFLRVACLISLELYLNKR